MCGGLLAWPLLRLSCLAAVFATHPPVLPACQPEEFKLWARSLVDNTGFDGSVDSLGLFNGGPRIGQSICARWPSLPDPGQAGALRCYRAGDFDRIAAEQGASFDLCKVDGMSLLMPHVFASAWLAIVSSLAYATSLQASFTTTRALSVHCLPLPLRCGAATIVSAEHVGCSLL